MCWTIRIGWARSGPSPPISVEQRLRAAGRAADDDDLGASPAQRPQHMGGPGLAGLPVARPRAARRSRAPPSAGLAEAADLGDQVAAEVAVRRTRLGDLAARRRLGDVVRGAGGQRPHGDRRPRRRQRRGDDDAQVRVGGEQLRQRGEAVHHRHLDVEDDDVDAALGKRVQRHLPVGRRRRHFEVRLLADEPRQQAADDGGIVDDQDPDRARLAGPGVCGRGGGSASDGPITAPLPSPA